MNHPSESIPSVDAEPVPPRNVLESAQEFDLEEETFPKHTASVDNQTLCQKNTSHESNPSEIYSFETQQSVGREGESATAITAHSQDDTTARVIPTSSTVQPLPSLAAVRPDDWFFKRFIIRLAKEIGNEDLELLKERFSGIVVFQQNAPSNFTF